MQFRTTHKAQRPGTDRDQHTALLELSILGGRRIGEIEGVLESRTPAAIDRQTQCRTRPALLYGKSGDFLGSILRDR